MLHFADLRRHAFACLLALSCAAMPPSAQASAPDAPDEAAYRRSLQLREQWMYLTTGLAGPATWIDGERYRYRRTAPGGFEFVVRRLGQAQAQAAFDQARLATALAPLLGRAVDGRRLPFADYEMDKDGQALRAWMDDGWVRCELGGEYRCARWSEPGPAPRPRAWGVVRDLSMAADATSRRSPDGRMEAFVRDGSVLLRTLADGSSKVLARDGADNDFYDPESIAWSPDSSRFMVLRVRPGDARRGRHHLSLLLSSLARSRAPRLVVPALPVDWLRLAMASCWSAASLARTDSWMLRVLRSTLTTTAVTSSPTFSTWLASSTRSRLISLARR